MSIQPVETLAEDVFIGIAVGTQCCVNCFAALARNHRTSFL